ncbi:hypothetical protein RJ639_038152 [Escallonia herrerae]|uniref:F-box domain-containing protein n=1 Tax=Escallonia herrerae TaxID=1293975 RepID=A0AA88WK48_9ASTE|nr:hypothetical protein RJ639_038152 [Escallonia herrerae]
MEENDLLVSDRISSLPDHILHQIISLLPTKYAARTSTLSRRWESLWSAFPVVDIDEYNVVNDLHADAEELEKLRSLFIQCLERSLSRRRLLHLEKLRIQTVPASHHSGDIYHLADKFLDAAIKGSVKELDLSFLANPHLQYIDEECESCYRLPEVVFLLGSCLVCLVLEGCLIEANDVINLPLLKTLVIRDVHISDGSLKTLIQGSPKIESLSIRHCHELITVQFSHFCIKSLASGGCRKLEELKLDLPILKYFKFKGHYIFDDAGDVETSTLNAADSIGFCSTLNTLSLSYMSMIADTFHQLLSNFPNLERMKLRRCQISDWPRISGENLKKLVMKDCFFEDKLDIRARNLQSIFYVHSFDGCRFTGLQLKYLSGLTLLGQVEISDEDLASTVLHCPLLVSLTLKSCTVLKHIKILSPKLEFLIVDECLEVKDFRILAPNLLFFKYVGALLKFSQAFTSNKLTAELHFKEMDHQHKHNDIEPSAIRDILKRFSRYAKSITLVHECAWFQDIDLKGRSSCDPLDPHDCVRDHLIGVKMKNFEANEEEMRLVKFLLRKALRLRTMSISIKARTDLAFQEYHGLGQ